MATIDNPYYIGNNPYFRGINPGAEPEGLPLELGTPEATLTRLSGQGRGSQSQWRILAWRFLRDTPVASTLEASRVQGMARLYDLWEPWMGGPAKALWDYAHRRGYSRWEARELHSQRLECQSRLGEMRPPWDAPASMQLESQFRSELRTAFHRALGKMAPSSCRWTLRRCSHAAQTTYYLYDQGNHGP